MRAFCAAAIALSLCLVIAVRAGERDVRYLRYDEVAETLQLQADSGLPGSEIRDSATWDGWIRAQDAQMQSRIDRGIEDSISNFILYGTSYTSLARVTSVEEAASETGELIPATMARIRALALALWNTSGNERLLFVRDFLAKQGIARESVEPYFAENLRRFFLEQRAYQQKLNDAGASGDTTAVFLARGTLFETRGLSVDTSLLPNFALQETLRSMMDKGVLKPGSFHRIAVIGPGLDFADKRDGYDFYPLQTLQPFAALEAVARLGLGKAHELHVVCFDLNSAVNTHIATLAKRAREGYAYTIQLPRDVQADWSPAAISYWEKFGELSGAPVKPLPVPSALTGVASRAVAIRAQYASQISGYDLNIVAQTLDQPAGQKFDLVIATNILVYYDRLQQALAMANIARMMNAGGIFLANNVLPAQHTAALEYLGRKNVIFTPSGAYGDDVVVYRRH